MILMQTQEPTHVDSQTSFDGVLIQRVLAGDQQAFEGLVQRYHLPLFQFICHFLGDYDWACDVLQQVFLQVYLSLPTLQTSHSLKPWLFRVARNRCIDELRHRQAIHFSELELVEKEDDLSSLGALSDTSPLPEEVAERHDLQQHVRQAISALPPRFRMVVVLRYWAQLSFSEIGQVLGIPVDTAKTHFQRAKPLLRASLAGVR
jgi:RNA polymerase sigma factor (sigma-70 family)